MQLVSFKENIPETARLLATEMNKPLWDKGQVKPRNVVREKLFIRSQPVPPKGQEILLLTDQMMEGYPLPDKYIQAQVMVGYTLQDYINDIQDIAFDLNYPYILVFLGALQLWEFELRKVHQQVIEFMKLVGCQSPNSMVIFSGLLPRTVDFHKSRITCKNYSRAYKVATHELVETKGWSCSTVMVFTKFLDKQGLIEDPAKYFINDLYLLSLGIRKLRACWLRHLGYFPCKASEEEWKASEWKWQLL